MIERPAQINVPELNAGQIAIISWSSGEDVTGYVLECRFDDAGFIEIYSGPNTLYSHHIPDANVATYRVAAVVADIRTWDQRDTEAATWDERDALQRPWEDQKSEWTTSEEHEINAPQPPVISGQDEDLGSRYRGFQIPFSVTDPDQQAQIGVTVTLDGETIFSLDPIQQGVSYTIQVTDDQIFAMDDGSQHTVVITARSHLTATRTFTFTAVEDLVSTAIFYVLRDGIPIKRLTTEREWTDYTIVGTHTYVIRAVDRYDNFTDSNPVTITVSVPHPIIAPVDDPGSMFHFIVRRGEYPQMQKTVASLFEEVRTENAIYPRFANSKQMNETYNLSYTHISAESYNRLVELIGSKLIYRDQFEDRAFGRLSSRDEDNVRKVINRFQSVSNFTAQFIREEHTEVIEYA